MGHPPLANYEDLKEIRKWLSHHGFLRLEDIFVWDEARNWQSWAFPRVPKHLQSQQNILRAKIIDSASITSRLQILGVGETPEPTLLRKVICFFKHNKR